MTKSFKNWIAELKTKTSNKDVLAVIEEMEAEVSMESRIKGTILTVCLCQERGIA